MKMLPGMGKISDDQLKQGEVQLKRCEAMINSMTPKERRDPDLLASSPSRRRRVAGGSGYKEADVSKLVSDFQRMRSMMQQMGQGNFPGMPGGMFGGMGGGMADPYAAGGRPAAPGWRGYNSGAAAGKKKQKKDKKKKGFGTL